MALTLFVRGEWGKHTPALARLEKMEYSKSDRSEILFILARIACHLEDSFALTSNVGFTVFWQRDRGQKTFDIEHIFKEVFDTTGLPAAHGFKDAREYGALRNLIGALILLPRSRNRSLQDKSYVEKLSAYATENILGQTLSSSLYQSNPNVATYVAANPGIGLGSISDFTKASIDERARSYTKIAEEIWKCP